jgi:prepilin-type N-terminal cleavage/methylation domain-containing protein
VNNTVRRSPKGFTLIELLIVIAVIAILAAIAIPNLLSSRKAANESSAIASLRTLVSAQETFRSRQTPPTYATSLTGLGTLIDPVLGNGAKSGYTFAAVAADANTYSYTASPTTAGTSGDRFFFVDQTGVIRVNDTGTASGASSPIQ